MAHRCKGYGCSAVVADHLLMCPRHWRMVPAEVKDQVYSTHRRGLTMETLERQLAVDAAIDSTKTEEQHDGNA